MINIMAVERRLSVLAPTRGIPPALASLPKELPSNTPFKNAKTELQQLPFRRQKIWSEAANFSDKI